MVRPTSWISGWFRLHMTRAGEFSNVKSASLMGEVDFVVVMCGRVFSFLRREGLV